MGGCRLCEHGNTANTAQLKLELGLIQFSFKNIKPLVRYHFSIDKFHIHNTESYVEMSATYLSVHMNYLGGN